MKNTVLAAILILLLGCHRDTRPPRTYEELQKILTAAIKHHDSRIIERLYSPDDSKDLRDALTLCATGLPTNEVSVYVTDIFPVWIKHHIEYPKADKCIFITASDGERGKIGVTTYSLFMLVTDVDGVLKLRSVDQARDSGDDQTKYEFALTVSDSQKLAGNLKNRKPHTFENQFSGREFISASMSDLAAVLSTFTGFHVVDQTSIPDDYDFSINFFNVAEPSTDKVALNSIGLDLILLKQSPPNQAQVPRPESVTPAAGAPVAPVAAAAHL